MVKSNGNLEGGIEFPVIGHPGLLNVYPAEDNPSGILPTEFKVLVRPVAVEEKIGSIYIPDQHKDKEQFAQQEGILIAVSPAAFTYFEDNVRNLAPKPGDRVLFAKYAGFTRKGNDGVEYRIVNDKDICAVLT